MAAFRRAFAISICAVFLVFMLVFGFELVNRSVSKSGFSSGEVLVFELKNQAFSGEILGRRFLFDLSGIYAFFSFLEKLCFLLPAPARFFIAMAVRLAG